MLKRLGIGSLVMALLAVLTAPQSMARGDDFEEMVKKKWNEMVEKYDRNKDGKITEKDVDDEELFKKFDHNDDGKIDMDDVLKTMKKNHEKEKEKREKEKHDKEKDRELGEIEEAVHKFMKSAGDDECLDLKEWKNAGGKKDDFDIADRDGDAGVSREEMFEYLKAKWLRDIKHNPELWNDLKKNAEARRKEARKDKEDKPRPDAKKEHSKKDEERAVKRAKAELEDSDSDHDGKLSDGEWLFGEQSFEDADKNGDGYLNREEVTAYFLSRMGGIDTGNKEED